MSFFTSPAARGDDPRSAWAVQITLPSQEELGALPADRRLELLDLQRQEADRQDQRRNRKFNTWILALGVLATVGTLLVTALTLRSGQEQLTLAREGQVTDRYAKAVEHLGSEQRGVRAAAVYALERIAVDSPRDALTIRKVLAAFVREHASAMTAGDEVLREAGTDIHAALTVLGRSRPHSGTSPDLDLRGIRLRIDLHGDDLDLRKANLLGADLRESDLSRTNLSRSRLGGADLRKTMLAFADLSGASFYGTDLRGAFLVGADLRGAKLGIFAKPDSTEQVSAADLRGADLSGADLRGVEGMSEAEIRRVAKTDESTRFGPIATP